MKQSINEKTAGISQGNGVEDELLLGGSQTSMTMQVGNKHIVSHHIDACRHETGQT